MKGPEAGVKLPVAPVTFSAGCYHPLQHCPRILLIQNADKPSLKQSGTDQQLNKVTNQQLMSQLKRVTSEHENMCSYQGRTVASVLFSKQGVWRLPQPRPKLVCQDGDALSRAVHCFHEPRPQPLQEASSTALLCTFLRIILREESVLIRQSNNGRP